MPFGVAGRVRARALLLIALFAAAGCSSAGVFRQYEYEEELYLALDGSVTVNVNASVASLVALRGVNLDPDPNARIDQDQRPRTLRRSWGARHDQPGEARSSPFRPCERESGERRSPVDACSVRLVDVSIRTQRRSVRVSTGGRTASGAQPSGIRWTGDEIVAFRLHLPSEIVFHNSPSGQVERGNILEWEQPLAERLAGRPVEMEVHLETESILYTTLLLFGSTIVAAAATLLFAVWWIARRGRGSEVAPDRRNDVRDGAADETRGSRVSSSILTAARAPARLRRPSSDCWSPRRR